jgi:hypothetical protein
MKKYLIFFVVLLSLTYSVTALNFVTGDTETLFGTCILADGSLGGDNMTLTVYYPNTTVFINDVTMNNYATGYFNYTFVVPNVTGTYPYSMTCSDSGVTQTSTDEFIVYDFAAKDVFQVNNTFSSDFGELGSMFIPILLSILLLVGSAIIDKEHKFFKIVLFIASFIPVFMLLLFNTVITDNSTLKDTLAGNTSEVTYIFIVIVAYFLLFIIYKVFSSIQAKKNEKYKY